MRLTQEIRHKIIEQITSPRLKETEKRHVEEKHKLFLKLYKETHTPKIIEQMKQLPAGSFPPASSVQLYLRVDGWTIGYLPPSEEHEALPCLFSFCKRAWSLRSEDSKAAAAALECIQKQRDENTTDKKHLEEVKALVNSASTDKALVQAWPEIEAIVRQYCAEGISKGKAVAVLTEPLNEIFKLPRNKKVDA